MNKIFISLIKFFLIFTLFSSYSYKAYSEEIEAILKQLQEDIKTLEKAVYSQDTKMTSSGEDLLNGGSDVLTKHLLKLSELEEQFQALTNNFEEINFKLDKLSNRITKVQTDNQIRFQDLEESGLSNTTVLKKKKKLPGSSEAQDLGQALEIGVADAESGAEEQIQRTQSVESVGTVITETAERAEKILPKGSPEEQYEFAVGFIKVGDYETAEFALREFVDDNSSHELAGNAQYWYGETFRVRQLYQDAATAYLNGYQKYPKSSKAPVNLLKLGVMLVQIGEKEQGCSMILGVKSQYPKANQSIIQKAEYEKKKFNCNKKS
jgi:tol-pal system protein YbgF